MLATTDNIIAHGVEISAFGQVGYADWVEQRQVVRERQNLCSLCICYHHHRNSCSKYMLIFNCITTEAKQCQYQFNCRVTLSLLTEEVDTSIYTYVIPTSIDIHCYIVFIDIAIGFYRVVIGF